MKCGVWPFLNDSYLVTLWIVFGEHDKYLPKNVFLWPIQYYHVIDYL